MEVIKQNCNYTITDTLENRWKLNGNATKDISGYITINYNVTDELGTDVGNYNYSKQADSNRVSISYNVVEEKKSEFVNYSDTAITDVLTQLNTAE